MDIDAIFSTGEICAEDITKAITAMAPEIHIETMSFFIHGLVGIFHLSKTCGELGLLGFIPQTTLVFFTGSIIW